MILRHGATYLVSSVASATLGLAATLLLTRLLGPEAFGAYGLGQTASTFVLYAGFEWLTWVVAPLLAARARTDRAVAATLNALFAWTSCVVCLLLAGALPFIAPAMRGALASACVSAVALGYFQLTAQFAVVRLTPGRYVAMNLVRSGGTFGAVVGAALVAAPIPVLLAGPAVGALLGVAAGGRGRWTTGARYDPAVRQAAVRLGVPLAAVFAIYAIQLSADRWIIEAIAGTARLGQYVAASMTVQVPVSLLASAIGMAALPLALAAARQDDDARLQAQLRSNLALLAGLVVPAAIGVACVAPRLAPVAVGQAFVDATIALAPWLCAAALASALRANYFDHAFAIAARTRPQVAVMGTLAAVQIGLTIALLPTLGLKGAAAAEIAAGIVAGIASVCFGRRVCILPVHGRDMLAIGGGCVTMLAALELIPFPYSFAGAVAQIAVGVLVYGFSIVCLDLAGIGRSLLARLPRRRHARIDAAVLGILVLMTLGACGPKVPHGATAPVLYQPATARQTYLLQPGDEVEVRFFEVPQLDDRVAVRPDGRVSLQLAGDVDAAGHTVDELHDAMLARYRSILKNPQISVAVRTVAPQRIFVDGEVGKPGVVESADRITLAMAVAEAGGIKTSAEAKQVLLIRRPPHETRPQVSVLDLAAVQDGTNPSQDVQLATNDVVFVPRSGIGEVNRWVDIYLRQNIPVQFGYSIP